MKAIVLISFVFVCLTDVFATRQMPDYLDFEGKVYPLYQGGLLGLFFEKHPEKKQDSTSSANWRGYIATYVVTNNILILKNIKHQVGRKKLEKQAIQIIYKSIKKEVFGDLDPVIIDWYSGIIEIFEKGDGKLKQDKYILIEVKKGKVVEVKKLNPNEYEELKEKCYAVFKKTSEYKAWLKDLMPSINSGDVTQKELESHQCDIVFSFGYINSFSVLTNAPVKQLKLKNKKAKKKDEGQKEIK